MEAQSAAPVRLKWWPKVFHRIHTKQEKGERWIPGRRNSMYKGAVARESVTCWGNPQQLSMPRIQSENGGPRSKIWPMQGQTGSRQ